MSEESQAVQQHTQTFGDYVILGLASLAVGTLAGLVIFWVLQLTPWALEQLDAPLTSMPAVVYLLELARLNLPWLAGLVVAVINYFKMKNLD